MLSSLLSKTSHGTNEESSQKDQQSIEESKSSSTLNPTEQVDNRATGTYPSPGSSPYHMEDTDDASILIVRCPSTSSVPQVQVVDGSLTYDNLKTPTDMIDDDSDKKVSHSDKPKNMEDFEASKNFDSGGFKDKSRGDKPFSEEGMDPLLLSLQASDLDMSAIKDLSLTIPPKVNETKDEFPEDNKKTADLNEETAAKGAKTPKSDNETFKSESEGATWSRMGLLHVCALRPLLLVSMVMGAALVFNGTHHYTRFGMTPTSPPLAQDVLTESNDETLALDDAPVIGSTAVTKDLDASAANTTLVDALADTHPDTLDEEQVIPGANTTNITGKPMEQEAETVLGSKRNRIGVSVATDDDTSNFKSGTPTEVNEHSSEISLVEADDNALCHGSHWDLSMPRLVLLSILLLATTSMFGSKGSDGHTTDDPIKDEFSLSPQVKKELESYDLSKYFDDHSYAQLREKLWVRKCNTTGKKHKLVQRLAAVYKAELETLTVVQLRKILKSKNFTQYGTKAEIIRVLVEDCP